MGSEDMCIMWSQGVRGHVYYVVTGGQRTCVLCGHRGSEVVDAGETV